VVRGDKEEVRIFSQEFKLLIYRVRVIQLTFVVVRVIQLTEFRLKCWNRHVLGFCRENHPGGVEVRERRKDTSERSDVERDNYCVLKFVRVRVIQLGLGLFN